MNSISESGAIGAEILVSTIFLKTLNININ